MRRAFSLIEVSVVLILVGLIAGISIPLLRSTTTRQNIDETRKELETIKRRVIAYYQNYSKVPPHIVPGYKLNQTLLQVPTKFMRDQISGIDYLYFSDSTGVSDSIKIDGISIGSIGCVLISAGPNGTFDGENATPGDYRFQSQGVDDILISISEYELRGTYVQDCQYFTVIVRNSFGSTIYAWPIHSRNTYTSIANNATVQFTNVYPNEYVIFSSTANFYNHQTTGFIPSKFDKGGNCIINITISTSVGVTGVPVFGEDTSF